MKLGVCEAYHHDTHRHSLSLSHSQTFTQSGFQISKDSQTAV